MKRIMTEEEVRLKAESYCVAAERSRMEVSMKLQLWGVSVEAQERILCRLEKEKYLDEKRYAAAYVRDKYRFNQWGRVKIAQMLRAKQVSPGVVSAALEDIDETEYRSILISMLSRKRLTVKASNDYERRGKLIRFALGRGYEMDEVLSCMQRIGCDDEWME